MPNLAGIWNPNLSREKAEESLARQLRRIRIATGRFEEYRLAGDGFAIGLLDHGIFENGPQPAADSHGMALFLDGEISNRQELAAKYRTLLSSPDLSPPSLCLELIGHRGFAVVPELQGIFCLVILDRARKRITLVSDRYGYRPLFYSHASGELVFGTELKAVACLLRNREIDEVGSLESFLFGSHVKDLTWLKDCVRLEPATILTVDSSGLRAERYWRYRYGDGGRKLDQEAYFSRFAVLLDRAVERSMRTKSHRLGMFLSGGYDSRSVAACIRSEHLPIPALTFGHKDSRDMRYAAMLSQRLGLDHVAVEDEMGNYLHGYCRQIVWRTEGMTLFSHNTSIRRHELIKSKMDIILTGFLAEFSGSHTWPGLMLARGREGAREEIFRRAMGGRLPLLERIFDRSFLKRTLPEVRRRFDACFDSLENDHPLDLADAWNLTFVQPRSTGQTSSVDRHVLENRAPHMDADLVDFLVTIPHHARIEQRVYKQTIAYAFPSIRDVPCTNSGKPIEPRFFREYLRMVGAYAGRKLFGNLGGLVGLKPGLGRAPRNLGEAFRAEPALMDDILVPMLQGDVFPAPMFNQEGIRAVIHEHYQRGEAREDALAKLISWGLAVKYFLHEDMRDAPAEIFRN